MHPGVTIYRTTASRFKPRNGLSAARQAVLTSKLDQGRAVLGSGPMNPELAVNV
jgi:hypothetical protein